MSQVDDAWQAVVVRLERAQLDETGEGESTEPDDPRNRLIYVGMDIDAVEVEEHLAKMVATFHAVFSEQVDAGEDPKGSLIASMRGLASQSMMFGWELSDHPGTA